MRKLKVCVAAALAASTFIQAEPTVASNTNVYAVDPDDWLGVVNAYRLMSGLSPVSENTTWSRGAAAHSNYMLLNGISHEETPGRPGYTVEGDLAGRNGNILAGANPSATARDHIDMWMTAPFHAIGILRHNLTSVGFGTANTVNPVSPSLQSAATLDILRGLDDSRQRPSTPVVFPGRGSTVPLHQFVSETPDPVTLCGWPASTPAGLPLIAMMPATFTGPSATLTGPSGAVEVCVLHAGNTTGLAADVLRSDHAVVVVPKQRLVEGVWSAHVETSTGSASWWFTVDLDAPVTRPLMPDTSPVPGAESSRFDPIPPTRVVDTRSHLGGVRLRAGTPSRFAVAPSFVTAVSANFTVADPAADGFLTVYRCGEEVPTASTVNFSDRAAAVQSIVPTSFGAVCMISNVAVDVIVDVNGHLLPGAPLGFIPMSPVRLFDTREPSGAPALRSWSRRSVPIAGRGGVPSDAAAVALNVTVVDPSQQGYLTVWSCDPLKPRTSNLNFAAGEVRANAAVVPLSPDGTVCIESTADGQVVVDVAGYLTERDASTFTSLETIRLLDSRSAHPDLSASLAGRPARARERVEIPIAGRRGIPPDAKAVTITVIAIEPDQAGFVTVFPCSEGPTPWVSSLNYAGGDVVANGATVTLGNGKLCVESHRAAHLVVDITGVFR